MSRFLIFPGDDLCEMGAIKLKLPVGCVGNVIDLICVEEVDGERAKGRLVKYAKIKPKPYLID